MKLKKFLSLLLLSAMAVSLGACASTDGGVTTPSTTPLAEPTTPNGSDGEVTTTAQPDVPPSSPEPLDKNKEYSVLFIGNSYTYYNSINVVFERIAKAAGYTVDATAITKGGWYLAAHADASDEMGKQVDAALKNNKYDFVILQEQSTCPILVPGKFYDGVRAILEKVKENGATPILYSTWGRKTGHKTLAENGLTNESMTWKLAAAYQAIGKELDIEVAYVGLAFYDVYTNNMRDVNLYDEDLTHPSSAGTTLAALTIFSEIFGVDPETIDFVTSFTDSINAILKTAAKKAVFETPEIPEKYRTESEGVVEEKQSYTIDASQMNNLKSIPSADKLISVLRGGTYPNGKSFSGILGSKNAISSKEFSITGLSDAQKADIADIGYGVSVIGIEKMFSSSKGYTTAVENLVNGHWGSSFMACFEFDENKYNINGKADDNAQYTGLITLNFGSKHKFDAFGFSSGSLEGFPGVAEVYVSDDGENWTRVPTACWDQVGGTALVNAGKTPADPWNGNTATVTCLFDMNGVTGQYIRLGVIIGRNDSEDKYNTINTREILVYGEKLG